MVLDFVDIIFFYTVPINIVMATLRWMGVPETDVRNCRNYKNTKEA